ncbi:Eco57I restriction-modification methylase domain-containing protein [Lentzea flava]|uniref:Eco57I restriction-modification methylase domain-containing protein n=1 Tax=Lentzea flava TaxID=103732 RepID=UPI001E3CE346|nr:Eco57I restriction-modification methylase domain-containing protein [Lentzea flava]
MQSYVAHSVSLPAAKKPVITAIRSAAQIEYGEVFTRRWVAEVMLDLAGYTVDRDLTELRLMEPACGQGAFLVPAVERLMASAVARGHVIDDRAILLVQACDVQLSNVERCREAVIAVLLRFGVSYSTANVLAQSWVCHGDYLLSAQANSDLIAEGVRPDFDVIVGNPPYIRFDDIDEGLCRAYRSRWPTMSGRVDVYVGFYECALRSLKPGGRLAFICPDRWMRNQYGTALREFVAQSYSVDAVLSVRNVDVFETPVAAYPAITVLSRGAQRSAVVAETNRRFAEPSAHELTAWTLQSNDRTTVGCGYRAFRLPQWFPGDEMWPIGSPARVSLVKYLNDNFAPLHNLETGTRVGIGITTGADNVYILNEDDPALDGIESDRLLRLAMARDTRSGDFVWGRRYLVNPWSRSGVLVDLASYPGLANYLAGHRSRLAKRYTAKVNPQNWHRTVDKVNHDLLSSAKLLVQDMQISLNPVLENEGCYPHHNLYYIVSSHWDMQVLGGILLSRVAQAFVEAYSIRMRGNTLRFQSQYLKKIRVPDYAQLGQQSKEALREAFLARDVEAATAVALRAYGLDADALVD